MIVKGNKPIPEDYLSRLSSLKTVYLSQISRIKIIGLTARQEWSVAR